MHALTILWIYDNNNITNTILNVNKKRLVVKTVKQRSLCCAQNIIVVPSPAVQQ